MNSTTFSRRTLLSGGAAMLAMGRLAKGQQPPSLPPWANAVNVPLLQSAIMKGVPVNNLIVAGKSASLKQWYELHASFTAVFAHLETIGFGAYTEQSLRGYIRERNNVKRADIEAAARGIGMALPSNVWGEMQRANRFSNWHTGYHRALARIGLQASARPGARSRAFGNGFAPPSPPRPQDGGCYDDYGWPCDCPASTTYDGGGNTVPYDTSCDPCTDDMAMGRTAWTIGGVLLIVSAAVGLAVCTAAIVCGAALAVGGMGVTFIVNSVR